MIPKETINTIIESSNIEEVVGDFVHLKKRGANLLGLCPFHNEKTPSFTVSPSKGIFKCFGCGKAGNSVNFIMEHEKYSYVEALKYLANKYNILIEEREATPEERIAETEREALFSINSHAQKFYSDTLFNSEEGKAIGHTYFIERGFREDIIKKFQLGFAPLEWDGFVKHAIKNGYKEELLVTSGLAISKDNKLYDRFRERVIFPIHNITGKVIGFGGRILTQDKTKPKYINSPETEVYNKSKSLYGIYYAKNSIVTKDNCFLVEGYTDVISLHQAGIENVVASSGTSLTTDQIKLIGKYTKNITILYDGDTAGIKASFRGIDMILEQGMNVKIVLFPEGEDPDSYARSHRTVDVEAFIATSADDFITFKTRLLLSETNNDPIKKAGLIHEILNSISLISDPIIRSLYVKECAQLMNIAEGTLLSELNKLFVKKLNKNQQTQTAENEEIKDDPEALDIEDEKKPGSELEDCSSQEHEVIRLLLLYGDKDVDFEIEQAKSEQASELKVAQLICNDIRANQMTFKDPVFQRIFDIYAEGTDRNEIPTEKVFFMNADYSIAKCAIDIITPRYELSDGWVDYRINVPKEDSKLHDACTKGILSLIHRKLFLLILENQKEAKDLPMESEEWINHLSREIFLKQALKEISRKLGRTLNY